LRRKGGIFLIGLAVLLGFIGITGGMFIYWLTTFKIHIYQVIIEVYHYNRVQEIPLALISSDFGKPFVERVNRVYYGFEEGSGLKNEVEETVKKQLGEACWWKVNIRGIEFESQPGDSAITMIFFNETFPFPLVFNGSNFVTEMRFNAYA